MDVEPDEVRKLARAHRPARTALHRGVEILGRDARLVEHADAVVQQRDQHAVDDEARGVVAADRRLAKARPELGTAVSNGSSPVSSARTISTSGISGAGLKKCMPTTRSGVEVAAAISVTESADVFVASTASGRQIRSSSAKSARLGSSSSTIASITTSQSARSARSVVSDSLLDRRVALGLPELAPSRPCA